MHKRVKVLEAEMLHIRSMLVSVLKNSDDIKKDLLNVSHRIQTVAEPKATPNCCFAACTFEPKRCSASTAITHMQHCAHAPSDTRHLLIVRHILQKFHHPRITGANNASVCCWCNQKFGQDFLCATKRSLHRNSCGQRVLNILEADPFDANCIAILDEVWTHLLLPSSSPNKRERCDIQAQPFSPPMSHFETELEIQGQWLDMFESSPHSDTDN